MSSDPRLFRYLVEASTDGIWLLDGEGRTVWSNARMAALLGRTPAEMSGLSAYDVHDDDGRQQFAAHMAKARAGDSGHDDLETMYVRPDGEPIWLLCSWRPVQDDDDRVIGYLHRYTDYTERRELLDALRDRESRLAEAQAIASIGSWEWDAATGRSTWSNQLFRIYGVTEEEFAATKEGYLDYVHPDDRAHVVAEVGKVYAGADALEWTARVVRGDGEVRWVRGLGRVERDRHGRLTRMAGTDQDITDKVLAELEIHRSNRRQALLRQVAEIANQSTGLVEALLRTAEALRLVPGWDPLCAFFPDGDQPELVPLLLSRTRPPHDIVADPGVATACHRSGNVAVRPVCGHEETHSLVAFPVRHSSAVACVAVVLVDQAPLDSYSRDVMEQISNILGRVAERERAAAELAEARDQAMEASRMKSEFLATMSHEIRTPMNGVLGLTDLLLRTGLDEEQRALTGALHGAGTTLRAIINDILDLSKIEAGKLELELVDFSVHTVLEQTVPLFAGQASEKGLALSVDVAAEVPPYLRGDSTRFGQVIANLGSNAVKFTDSGEVRIAVGVLARGVGHTDLVVSVADTGPGIARDAQQRLFDAFTQADPSTTRRHGGTGLGLTIARQLVSAMDGRITVESEPGCGSTFRFTARFATASGDAPAAVRPVAQPRPAGAAKRRVLVVEDNHVNQIVAVGMLENAGFEAAVVADGVEAVEALTPGHGFAAVLMDCRMPRMDGFAATRAIRAQEAPGQRVPIIAMTASALAGERERCLESGMDDFLTKPVDSGRVERVLHRWIDGSGAAAAVVGSYTDRAGSDRADGDGAEDDGAEDYGAAMDGPGIVDPERFDMLHEMVKEGISLFQRSSGNFIAHAGDHLSAIRAAVDAGHADDVCATAHKLKGSALNLGLPRVGRAAAELEEQGRAAALVEAQAAYLALVHEMEQALEALTDARAARA